MYCPPSERLLTVKDQQEYVIFDSTRFANTPCYRGSFDVARLESAGRIRRVAHGRGPAYFIDGFGQQRWVLRHYYRGGIVARVNGDRFLGTTVSSSRSFREFRMLSQLYDLGIAAPRPVAARVQRHTRFWYTADIITEEVVGARTLEEQLLSAGLALDTWATLGRLVARLHRQGFEHQDLNVRNVLLASPSDELYLIDFDKARRRPPGTWRARNIERFKRSLSKLTHQRPDTIFAASHWQAFISAYEKGFE